MGNKTYLLTYNRLSVEENLTVMAAKVSKTITLLCMLQHILPKHALITIIYRAFIHPCLDYGDSL